MHCWFRILNVYLISIYFFVAQGTGQELPWATPEEVGLSQVRLDRMTETIQSYIVSNKVTGTVTLIMHPIGKEAEAFDFKPNGSLNERRRL